MVIIMGDCKVEGCKKGVMYKARKLCQMHYFRFMRNGTYKLKRKRKYRQTNPAGYQLLYIPGHHLSQNGGYIYEHRKVAYDKYGDNLPDCELCGKECTWDIYTTHIDHIDEDVTNNDPENLRPLCCACNSRRNLGPSHEKSNSASISFSGETMTAAEWSRDYRVKVCGSTILRRKKRGMSDNDALFLPKKTHKELQE